MGEPSELLEKRIKYSNITSGAAHDMSHSGVSLNSPAYNVTAGDTEVTQLQSQESEITEDTFSGEYANEQDQIKTDSGFTVNNPEFNAETMRNTMPNSRFRGANTPQLEQAMITLYGDPEGQELEKALETIAEIRGLKIGDVREQYRKAMKIKDAGEARAKAEAKAKGEEYDPVSPSFDTADLQEGGRHHGFTGSTGQLRFGMVIGDVFGLDPVFGSLISPTGGAVGPGSDSLSQADPNNPTVMHGVVHDAAGYLLNAHGVGPGYNYLNADWELDSSNPLAGQSSGTAYWAGRGRFAQGAAIAGTAISNLWEHGFSEENALHSAVQAGEGNWATRGVDAVGGLASDAWGGIKSGASSLWGGAKGLAGDAWGGIKSGASSLWGGAKGLASDAWGGAKKGAKAVGGAASDAWNGAKGLASDAWGGTKRGAKAVGGAASDAWGGIKGGASSLWGGAKNKASGFWNGMKNFPLANQKQQDHGTKPEGDGAYGPHAYSNTVPWGWNGGLGLAGLNYKDSNTSILSAEGGLGVMEGENGSKRYGLSASGGVVKQKTNINQLVNGLFGEGTMDPSIVAELELGAGTAGADAWVDPENGFSLGAQANAAEGAATFGTTGTGNKDKTARFGLSAGVGAAARGHWGDSDGDGFREYGFGFDAGPFSVDVKSEDPIRDFVLGSIPGASLLGDMYDGNMTHDGANAISGLASDAWGGAKKGASAVAGLAGDAWGGAKKGASSAWGGLKGLAGGLWGGAKKGGKAIKGLAGDAWRGAKKGASSAWGGMKGLAGGLWGGAKKGAGKAGKAIKGLAGDAWGGAKKGASSIWGGAKKGASSIWGGAKKGGKKIGSTAKKGWKKFKSWF